MDAPKAIAEIDLTKSADRVYWSGVRPFSEEVIYFLLVDRFHDGKERHSVEMHGQGFGTKEQWKSFCGGTFLGVKRHLGYIRHLGCTALWLSPVFENNDHTYHGYAIQHFLRPDPRFGTLGELQSLVAEAHALGISVYLDIVINHTGDNWEYEGELLPPYQAEGYSFGAWKREDRPLPVELRKANLYEKKGAIQHWDTYPETLQGDIFELKKLRLDSSAEGRQVQDILFTIYAWWIKTCDFDGFRVDTVKHVPPATIRTFCGRIRDYARYLGKKDFVLLGEVAASYPRIARYAGGNDGLNAFLDFPFHYAFGELISGRQNAKALVKVFRRARKLGKSTVSVVFLDNHDQLGQQPKQRLAAQVEGDLWEASVYLMALWPGVPCIYYGTEQQLHGRGEEDGCIRECMFDLEEARDGMSRSSPAYLFIQKVLKWREEKMFYDVLGQRFHFFAFTSREGAAGISIKGLWAYSVQLKQVEIWFIFNRLEVDAWVQPNAYCLERGNNIRFVSGQGEIDAQSWRIGARSYILVEQYS